MSCTGLNEQNRFGGVRYRTSIIVNSIYGVRVSRLHHGTWAVVLAQYIGLHVTELAT